MAYNYLQIIRELIDKAGIPSGAIFDINQHPLGTGIEENFLKRFQGELDTEKYWPINPARIFINPNTSLNACAFKHNGYYLINFNFGMFPVFLKLFTAQNTTFTSSDSASKYYPYPSRVRERC